MVKNIRKYIIVFILSLMVMNFNIKGVKAGFSPENTSGDASGIGEWLKGKSSNNGVWYPKYVGFRIGIWSKTNGYFTTINVYNEAAWNKLGKGTTRFNLEDAKNQNPNDDIKYLFVLTNKSKPFSEDSNLWHWNIDMASNQIVKDVIGFETWETISGYSSGIPDNNGVKGWLNDGKLLEMLKKIDSKQYESGITIKRTFYNGYVSQYENYDLQPDDRIIVEPLTAIGNFFGTPYELIKYVAPLDEKDPSYKQPHCSGEGFKWCYETAFIKTFNQSLYVNPGINEVNLKSYSSLLPYSCMGDKNCGGAIGVWKFSDLTTNKQIDGCGSNLKKNYSYLENIKNLVDKTYYTIKINGNTYTREAEEPNSSKCTGTTPPPSYSGCTTPGTIVVYAYDSDKKPIKEACFSIGDSEQCTDINGKATFSGLKSKKYTVVQTPTSNGYSLSKKTADVDLSSSNALVGSGVTVYASPATRVSPITKVSSATTPSKSPSTPVTTTPATSPTTPATSPTTPSNPGSGTPPTAPTVQIGCGTVFFELEKTCKSELEYLKAKNLANRENLSELYTDYLSKGKNYNGLLNFNNPSCSNISCSYTDSTQCLSGSYGYSSYSKDNLSCYNGSIGVSDDTVYCLNSINLSNGLGSINFTSKTGMMPIQYNKKEDASAVSAILNSQCYYAKTGALYSNPNISSYLPSIKFNDELLDMNGSCDGQTCSVNYYLNPVYAKNGSAETNNIGGNNYKFLGYGIVSKFNATTPYDIPYTVRFSDIKKYGLFSTGTYTANCKVTPSEELMPKLNLEFREIDTTNPFPGKSGSNRIVGTNWRSRAVDYDTSFQQKIQNYINTYGEWVFSNDNNYDVNKDGKVNNEDLKIATWITNNYYANSLTAVSNKSNNSLIAYVMKGRNNSFNQTKEGPIYSIKLTSTTIKAIQDYNKNNPYDDYNLSCQNGENCKSNFLKDLKDGKIDGISVPDKLIKK